MGDDLKDHKWILEALNDIWVNHENVFATLVKGCQLWFSIFSSFFLISASEDYQGDDMGGGDFDSGKQ